MLGARIRQFRNRKGLTLAELAEQAGVSKSMISQIENGKATPSVETVRSIALALDVPVYVLFLDDDHSINGLVRRQDRIKLIVPDSSAEREMLTPDYQRKMVLVIARLGAALSSSPSPVTHLGEECILVLKGTITLDVGDSSTVLNAGDAYYFNAQMPHRCRNTGDSEAEYLSIATKDWEQGI